jgi:hypothetical protein
LGREDERCGSDQDKKTKQNISPEQIITSSRLLRRNLLPSYFRLVREKGEKGPLGASEDIPLSSTEPSHTHEYVVRFVSQTILSLTVFVVSFEYVAGLLSFLVVLIVEGRNCQDGREV